MSLEKQIAIEEALKVAFDENELKKVSLAYLLPFQASSFVNFAPWAIIHSSQQITIFCAYPAIISLFLS